MITMKELDLNDYDYDYRFDLQDGTTLGYVKHNRFLGCEFYYGSTQSTAYANNDSMLYGDTPSSIKDALESEYAKKG